MRTRHLPAGTPRNRARSCLDDLALMRCMISPHHPRGDRIAGGGSSDGQCAFHVYPLAVIAAGWTRLAPLIESRRLLLATEPARRRTPGDSSSRPTAASCEVRDIWKVVRVGVRRTPGARALRGWHRDVRCRHKQPAHPGVRHGSLHQARRVTRSWLATCNQLSGRLHNQRCANSIARFFPYPVRARHEAGPAKIRRRRNVGCVRSETSCAGIAAA
jgi:hypothetical protein